MNTSDALKGRNLLLGVTASIAAYKTPALVRLLKRYGAQVQVLTTPTSTRFVTPETLATVSGLPVLTDMFAAHDTWTQHVELGEKADLLVIAPLSAHTLAKLVCGLADSMLTATVLSARCPILVCPAMDHEMYQHPAVQRNIQTLRQLGYHVTEAEWGSLASGATGYGRMPEPETIAVEMSRLLRQFSSLAGKHAVVTAGPTREPIDAVRVITNPSTGTMGFALAEALARRGANVTLIAGPTLLPTPRNMNRIDVTTAAEMHNAIQDCAAADYVFMAAAVADFTPVTPAAIKLGKREAPRSILLQPTIDILRKLGENKQPGQLLVGFAMETHHGLARASQKLTGKNLDYIVLNYINEAGAGFGPGTNKVTVLGKDGTVKNFQTMPKRAVAEALLTYILP